MSVTYVESWDGWKAMLNAPGRRRYCTVNGCKGIELDDGRKFVFGKYPGYSRHGVVSADARRERRASR